MMEKSRRLLEKFLAGTCTEEELWKVKQLFNSDRKAGGKMLAELMEQRELPSLNDRIEDNPAKDAILSRKLSELRQHMTTSRNVFHRRLFLNRIALYWTSIAAFVWVIILVGTLLWQSNDDASFSNNRQQTLQCVELTNSGGIPQPHQLSDGTQIWLAAGSTLRYSESFSKKDRNVELSGEAFFDVVQDEKRPFTIRTGEMETRVLGTSFKITAFTGQEQEVAVVTGKVSVSNKGKELALLTRGRQVRYNPITDETTQAEIDPVTLEQWKSGVIVFNGLPMRLVAKQLENRYGIKIKFANPQIASVPISGTFFPEESAVEILKVIDIIGGFQYKSTDEKHYMIY